MTDPAETDSAPAPHEELRALTEEEILEWNYQEDLYEAEQLWESEA
jgi:hypothetical protein